MLLQVLLHVLNGVQKRCTGDVPPVTPQHMVHHLVSLAAVAVESSCCTTMKHACHMSCTALSWIMTDSSAPDLEL